MLSRRENIVAADVKTLQWVFAPKTESDTRMHISHWLRKGDDVFWLSGKSGSGKSTLMNFLVSSPQTASALTHPAGGSNPMIVSYFFWGSGKTLQRDIQGLLRACVYRIVENDRLMMDVLHDLLAASGPFPMDMSHLIEIVLSETKLQSLLFALLDNGRSKSFRHCFFIDAIGECEGRKAVLLRLLEELASRTHMKICVSSCPWPSLEHHFRDSPQLSLQDLTCDDIPLYINERLNNQVARSNRTTNSSSMMHIILHLISRFNGNFLRAMIATRIVCERLADGDGLDPLLTEVQFIPADVHELIKFILQNKSSAGTPDSGLEYLASWATSDQPIDLVTFAVASIEEVARSSPLGLLKITLNHAEPMIDKITSEVSTRTTGLLQMSRKANELGHPSKHPVFLLRRHEVGFVHDSIAAIVKESFPRSTVSLMRLLKASVLIAVWLRASEQTESTKECVRARAFHWAQAISELDENEHSHDEFLGVLERDMHACEHGRWLRRRRI